MNWLLRAAAVGTAALAAGCGGGGIIEQSSDDLSTEGGRSEAVTAWCSNGETKMELLGSNSEMVLAEDGTTEQMSTMEACSVGATGDLGSLGFVGIGGPGEGVNEGFDTCSEAVSTSAEVRLVSGADFEWVMVFEPDGELTDDEVATLRSLAEQLADGDGSLLCPS